MTSQHRENKAGAGTSKRKKKERNIHTHKDTLTQTHF